MTWSYPINKKSYASDGIVVSWSNADTILVKHSGRSVSVLFSELQKIIEIGNFDGDERIDFMLCVKTSSVETDERLITISSQVTGWRSVGGVTLHRSKWAEILADCERSREMEMGECGGRMVRPVGYQGKPE